MCSEAVKWYLYAAETSQDTTVHVGALMEAADISETELNNREDAKTLYLEAITAYPDNVYESELRNKLGDNNTVFLQLSRANRNLPMVRNVEMKSKK